MRKNNFILMFILFGLVSIAYSQSPYYWYGNKKVELQLINNKILVTFKQSMSRSQIEESLFNVVKKRNTDVIIADNSLIVDTELGFLEEKKRWLKNKDVLLVTPFYKDSNTILMAASNIFYVKIKNNNDQIFKAFISQRKVKVIEEDAYTKGLYKLICTNGNALDEANYWAETNDFEFAEPNFINLAQPGFNNNVQKMKLKSALIETNDNFLDDQWSIENTGIPHPPFTTGTQGCDMNVKNAWSMSQGNNITIAILDVGVDLTHPDLIDNLVLGFDATDGHGNCGINGGYCNTENDFHGTACAGIAAASANNMIGIAGIAFSANLMPIRVGHSTTSNNSWTLTNAWIASGIDWAYTNGASVLSLSFGVGQSSIIDQAISNAVTNGRNGLGSLVFCSAGNNNSTTIGYPAANINTIAVGAVSMCFERKNPSSCDPENWGSDYGVGLDLCAPGVQIYTTDIVGNTGYANTDYDQFFNGTSSACPNAAGIAALMLAVGNQSNTLGTTIRNHLENSCKKIGGYSYNNGVSGQPNGTWSQDLGYGLVDAEFAIEFLIDQGCYPNLNLSTDFINETRQYRAQNILTSNSDISASSVIKFKAGDRITLSDGFKVRGNSYFKANIIGCN